MLLINVTLMPSLNGSIFGSTGLISLGKLWSILIFLLANPVSSYISTGDTSVMYFFPLAWNLVFGWNPGGALLKYFSLYEPLVGVCVSSNAVELDRTLIDPMNLADVNLWIMKIIYMKEKFHTGQ